MKRAYKSTVILFCLGLFFAALPAQAQLAPTPRKSPRTPVRQEKLVTPEKPSLPSSRLLQGSATILDSERVKINGIEMRLFGVVPPLLSASYGPQARATLDALARSGATTCRVRDRTRDGHLLSSCKNAENQDFGTELLRRGLAVTARGTLHGTELATPYIAAEEAAKAQRLGLWSVTPIAASDSSILKAAQKEKEKAQAEQAVKEQAAKEEAAKKEEQTPEAPPKAESETASLPPPALTAEEKAEALGLSSKEPEAEAPPFEGTALQDSLLIAAEKGFVETYQLLITGLVLLLAASIFAGSFVFVRFREKKDSLRATAAALRGELMAARAICLARLSRLAKENDEKTISWPRLRNTVFQAYVGQLGRLGTDLSRQIASIYGQSADYASYYVGAEDRPDAASKKQSLQTLVQHIEDVVPRLADIEQRGAVTSARRNAPALSSLLARVTRPIALPAQNKANETEFESLPAPERLVDGESTEETEGDAPAEKETLTTTPQSEETTAEPAPVPPKEILSETTESARESKPQAEERSEKKKQDTKPASNLPPKPRPPRGGAKKRRASAAETKTPPALAPTQTAIAAAKDALLAVMRELDLREPLAESFAQAKSFAADKWKKINPPLSASIEDIIPDYANLTEEELEALAYADEYLFSGEEDEKDLKTG